MRMASPDPVPQAAQDVLGLLKLYRNVLVSGPPGAGKSRLLAQVAEAFKFQAGGPGYVKTAKISIPASVTGPPPPYLPSPTRTDRAVYRTALHAGSKPRDFLRGVVPSIGTGGASLQFEVTHGFLYVASEHALTPDGTALLIVDEINRGPAVAVFGPSIVALEPDKRLDDVGQPTLTTQQFPMLDDQGHEQPYCLPTHLYIVAAMNQVDTSVAALDVAFLRRFAPYLLGPDDSVLRSFLGLTSVSVPTGAPASAADVYALLVAAWKKVNERIALGRGPEYQLGHGSLMLPDPPTALPEATAYAARAWATVRQHVDEIFFGDTRGVGEVLAADRPGSPYKVVDTLFAGQPVVQLTGPTRLAGPELLAALKSIANS